MFFDWYKFSVSKIQDYQGRAGRMEFLCFFTCQIIFSGLFAIVDKFVTGLPIVLPLFLVLTAVPTILICIRRLHDVGLSGFWMLLILIFPIFLIGLFFWPSEQEPNRYGFTERLVNVKPKPMKPLIEGTGYEQLQNPAPAILEKERREEDKNKVKKN